MILLLAHFAVTCFMAGVIWIIQVVHYPLFANVGESVYPDYQRLHMRKITWVVMPAMLFELITAGILVFPEVVGFERLHCADNLRFLLIVNLLGLVLIWLSTALFQVPLHTKLRSRFDGKAHHRLVQTNWLRTILWSLRGLLIFYLVMKLSEW